MWDLFEKLVMNIGHKLVDCVVDAVDECDEDDGQRSDLLRRIGGLITTISIR
jgi:hypothetical protein